MRVPSLVQVTVARKLAGLAARGPLPIPPMPGVPGVERVNNWMAMHESNMGINGESMPPAPNAALSVLAAYSQMESSSVLLFRRPVRSNLMA